MILLQKKKTRINYQVLSLLWNCILVVNISACEGLKPDSQPTETIDLHTAALCGNLSVIQKTLEQQSSDTEKARIINEKDKQGRTMLHVACKYGREEVVKLLLKNGADMTIKDLQGHKAIELANESIRYLLQAREQVIQAEAEEQQWKNEQLFKACKKGKLEEVKKWVEQEANVNSTTQWSNFQVTPLGIACGENDQLDGKLEIVQYLIEQGADVNQATGYFLYSRTSPLHLACQYNHQQIVKILMENGAQVNVQCDGGFTPLHKLCLVGKCPELVEYLVQHGADMNITTWGADRGKTPLYVACENGYTEVVQKLIDYKANVNEKQAWCISEYKSPLRIACEMGHVAVVKLLLQNGANADERIIFCRTVSKEVQEQVKSLLEKASMQQTTNED
jgi:ankyrin repeat protein